MVIALVDFMAASWHQKLKVVKCIATDEPEENDRRAEVDALRQRQQRELEEFQARQRSELEAFERKEQAEIKELEEVEHRSFDIKIDRAEFKVHQRFLTGAELRQLPQPPIGPDRDLFEVVPGGSDRKVADNQRVEMRDGLRFFTAPAQINPGA
jgi:hypothetical protein